MTRPFDFSPQVQAQARMRQFSICAHCGMSLDDVEEHAHHVYPNQSGDPRKLHHAWLRTEQPIASCYVTPATRSCTKEGNTGSAPLPLQHTSRTRMAQMMRPIRCGRYSFRRGHVVSGLLAQKLDGKLTVRIGRALGLWKLEDDRLLAVYGFCPKGTELRIAQPKPY